MTTQPLLIQFAKWPEKGRVKTRLVPALGEAGALEAHIRLTQAVLGQLMAAGGPLTLWWNGELPQPPPEAPPIISRLTENGIPQGVQSGSNLGERMQQALEAGIASHGAAIIVGSDCPSVDPDYIERARAALAGADVVLGPADDGGFVLIGARRTCDGMLSGVEWGTPRALEQTLTQLEKKGLRHACLEPLWDVDEPGDWARFLSVDAGSKG